MANYNLTSQQIKDTYQQLAQVSGSVIVDGTGSAVTSLDVSASYATSALTASYALNAEGVSVDTGSLITTASAALNVITFTKGDNSTFNVTVDTGSGAGGGLTPSEFYTYTASNDARVDSLTAATSSYLTSADISNKLDTSVFNTYTSSNDSRVDSLTAATSSYLTSADISNKLDTSVFNAYTSSNDSEVAGKLNTSVYTTNSSSVASRLTTNEGNISTNTSNISTQTSRIDSLVSATSSYAVKSSNNVFSGTQTFNNIAVNGTASVSYLEQVTGSAKVIGDSFIILNAESPPQRYAGIKVYDSGSSPVSTGSLQFDSQNNDWFYEYQKDDTDYAVALFGPEFATKGSPTYPGNNVIQKGTGGHHLTGSLLSDDGSTVSMTGTFDVTGAVSSSVGFKGSLDGNASTSTTASFALTASYVEGGAEAGLVNGSGTYSLQNADSLVGIPANASGNYSIAIGMNAYSLGDSSISIGGYSEASGLKSVGIGSGSLSTGESSTAVGGYSEATNQESSGFGYRARATGFAATAIGGQARASSNSAIALGANSEASANRSIAIGYSAVASAQYGIAMGYASYALGTDTVAIGYDANAYTTGTTVVGKSASATGTNNTAIGKSALAGFGGQSFTKATAVGENAAAKGNQNVAIGADSNVDYNKDQGVAIGVSSNVYADKGIAIGYDANTGTGIENVVVGASAQAGFGGDAGNTRSTAIGYGARAYGANDVCLGGNTFIDSSNDNSIVIGNNSSAYANNAIVIGIAKTASNTNEINIGDKFKYDGSSAITLDSSTIKVAASGSQTGSLIDNIHPAIASSSAQINHIVTLTEAQYTAVSSSGNAQDDTIYIVSDEGDYIHNGNLGISGQLYSPFSTSTVASSTSSIDFNESNFSNLSLTTATYIDNPSNLKSGTTYTLVITSGSLISNFNTAWKFASGATPTFSNGTDVLTMVSDGSNLYATALTDFQ